LYAANPDVGLQTTQRVRGTERYANISMILRAIIVRTLRRITITRAMFL